MRALRVLLVVLSACATTGCYVVSVSGLADTASSTFDESLLGHWTSREDDVDLLVERDEWRTYAITMRDRTGEQHFTGRLAVIGGARYVDLTIQHGTEASPALLPVHIIGRVTHHESTLRIDLLDYDWFRGRVSRGSLTTPAVLDERDSLLLTAPRAQLRRWLAANAATPALFAEVLVLTRDEGDTK